MFSKTLDTVQSEVQPEYFIAKFKVLVTEFNHIFMDRANFKITEEAFDNYYPKQNVNVIY